MGGGGADCIGGAGSSMLGHSNAAANILSTLSVSGLDPNFTKPKHVKVLHFLHVQPLLALYHGTISLLTLKLSCGVIPVVR